MKAKLIEILKSRKNHLQKKFSTYESRQLGRAIQAITDYVPPELFEQLLSDQPEPEEKERELTLSEKAFQFGSGKGITAVTHNSPIQNELDNDLIDLLAEFNNNVQDPITEEELLKQTADTHCKIQDHFSHPSVDSDEPKQMNFDLFKEQMYKFMFLDKVESEERLDELMHDWYILFKEMKYDDVGEWVEFQFPWSEVNESTHDFWRKMKCSRYGKCEPKLSAEKCKHKNSTWVGSFSVCEDCGETI